MVRLVKKARFEVDGATEANFLESPSLLRQCLEKLGVSGCSCWYDSRTEMLIVRASEGVFEVLEAILVENDVDQRIMSAIQRQKHRLSQKLLKKIQIRSATIQEIIDGIADDLPDPLLFVQRGGITLKPSRPVGRIVRLEGDDLMPSTLSRSSRPKAAPSPQDLRLNFSLENVTLFEFLQELARQTDTELIVGIRHIFMVPPSPLD
jgi:hypothetical protein